MKQKLTIILFLLSSSFSIAQIVFEKGYFIKNSGEHLECLIKNKDWKDNPISFEYKISQDSEVFVISLKEVLEFGVYEGSKFKKFNVGIDRSRLEVNDISNERAAILKKETLFLKVLVEGSSNLFSYEDHYIKRFFYNVGQKDVEQLVYKLYKNGDGKIGKNNRYRQQLVNSLKNDCITINQIKNIGYFRKELINLVLKYNNCNSNTKTTYTDKKQKYDAFNLTLRLGVNNSSLSIFGPVSGRTADFENELSLRLGIELEYVLPFNKNKWSIIMEPTFQNYNSEVERDALSDPSLPLDRKFVANYKSIQLPLGLRHSFFLSKSMKLFINASYVLDFDFDSEITIGLSREFDETKVAYPIRSSGNFAFGVGAKYDKFSAELRYGLDRSVLTDFVFWGSTYKSASLIFGYSLF